jgi:pantoate kinase
MSTSFAALLGRPAAIVRREDDRAGDALGDVLADLIGGRVVHRRRAGTLHQELPAGVAGNVDRQPAHEADVGIGVHLKARLPT